MMRRAAWLFGSAGLLVLARAATQLAGLEEHTSAIAGMPISAASHVLGPLHVAVYLLVVTLAPILAIAGTVDALLVIRKRA